MVGCPRNQRRLRYERIKNATVRMDRGVFLVRRELQHRFQVEGSKNPLVLDPLCDSISHVKSGGMAHEATRFLMMLKSVLLG